MTEAEQIKNQCRYNTCNYTNLYNNLLARLKSEQESGSEEQANQLWALAEIVKIHELFVEMHQLLKEKQFYNAWCKAEQVEIKCLTLERNNGEIYKCVSDLANMISSLQAIYPYKVFASHVARIIAEECSVCHRVRRINAPCGHRTGKVYNGKICYNIVRDFEFMGVDLVRHPVNKSCVIFPVDAQYSHRDPYNYSAVAHLITYWNEPFQYWTCKIKEDYLPIADCFDIDDDDECPCGSGETFMQCCKSTVKEIRRTTYHFQLD